MSGATIRLPRRSRPRTVNVFCIEGDWWGSLERERSSSIRPTFDMVAQMYPRLKYIHRTAATRVEFEHYLRVWAQAKHAQYPVLYLAFHGSPGGLHVGDQRRSDSWIDLDELATMLAGRCRNRIIHCGSCRTVAGDRRNLTRFLKTTGASAICGYTEDVGWLDTAAFEIQLLGEIQGYTTGLIGARAMDQRLRHLLPGLRRDLGFRFVVG